MHPPFELSERGRRVDGRPVRTFLHAHLWISARLERWNAELAGHLHLVVGLTGRETPRTGWHILDVTNHPFVLSSTRSTLPPDTDALLTQLMEHVEVPVLRMHSLGAVSMPGEPLDTFRSRVLGRLQQRLLKVREPLDTANGGLPGLASARALWNDDIEEVHLRPLARYVKLGQAGLLVMTPAVWQACAQGAVTVGPAS